jgi:hypothetical protein
VLDPLAFNKRQDVLLLASCHSSAATRPLARPAATATAAAATTAVPVVLLLLATVQVRRQLPHLHLTSNLPLQLLWKLSQHCLI